MPHLSRLLKEADKAGFADDDQLFNVNRFSPHYKSKVMNSDQVEAMYRKLTEGFYPISMDSLKRAENFRSCRATLRRIRGL